MRNLIGLICFSVILLTASSAFAQYGRIAPSGFRNCNLYGVCKFTDPRDGHVYTAKEFANQWWMVENLAFRYVNHQVPIQGSKHGLLYTWEAAKTICPQGWHLPSKYEFLRLVKYVCGKSSEKYEKDFLFESCVSKLEKVDFMHYGYAGTNPVDTLKASFWSTTEYTGEFTFCHNKAAGAMTALYVNAGSDRVTLAHGCKDPDPERDSDYYYLASVRCVKN